MDTPQYAPKQYLGAATLGANDALLSASVVNALTALCGTGLIQAENVAWSNPSALNAQAVFPTDFLAIFNNAGVVGLSQAHGTTPNADTQTYNLNLASFVPGSGSQTVYLYVTYFALGMSPVTNVGPPIGHPDYNPSFVPTITNTYLRDSFSLNAGTSVPAGSFEVSRTTLTAGQSGGVTFDVSHVQKASAYGTGLASRAGNIGANTAIGPADAGKHFDITTSGVAVTIPSPTTLPVTDPSVTYGFYYGASTGTSTLTISGSGVFLGGIVNGQNSITFNPQDFVLLQSDGTNYRVLSGSAAILGALKASNNFSDLASLTAALTNLTFASDGASYFKIPNPNNTAKPWIVQAGYQILAAENTSYTYTFPITFPNACIGFATSAMSLAAPTPTAIGNVLNASQYSLTNAATIAGTKQFWIAVGN